MALQPIIPGSTVKAHLADMADSVHRDCKVTDGPDCDALDMLVTDYRTARKLLKRLYRLRNTVVGESLEHAHQAVRLDDDVAVFLGKEDPQ